MRGQTIIRKDGTAVTEVTERDGQDCKNVYKLTESFGKQISEEVTGPDCDTTHETTFSG